MIYTLIAIALFAAAVYDAEWLLNKWFEKKVIVDCQHEPYLHRWYIFKSRQVTLFVHKFVASDEDRALHSHPWSFLVIPVWRGYIEHSDRYYGDMSEWEKMIWVNADPNRVAYKRVWNERTQRFKAVPVPPPDDRERIAMWNRVLPFLGTRFRRFYYRHRVELLKDEFGQPLPSWSIFFHFERLVDWGYWPKSGFIPHAKWWADLCE